MVEGKINKMMAVQPNKENQLNYSMVKVQVLFDNLSTEDDEEIKSIFTQRHRGHKGMISEALRASCLCVKPAGLFIAGLALHRKNDRHL